MVFVLESHERQADDLHNSAISLCLSMLEQAAQPVRGAGQDGGCILPTYISFTPLQWQNADIGVVRKVYYFIGRLFVFAWQYVCGERRWLWRRFVLTTLYVCSSTLFDDAASRDRFVFLYQTLLGGAERGDPETAMIILQSLDDLASRRRFFEKVCECCYRYRLL